jgi:hypothetical protein
MRSALVTAFVWLGCSAAAAQAAISIRVQLTETYTHVQPKTNSSWGSTATIGEVASASSAELTRNTILGGEHVMSAAFTAQLASGLQKCSWTGRRLGDAAPQITIERIGRRSYGMVGWPDRAGLAWRQTLARGSAVGCPSQAQFSPLQGPNVSSAPAVGQNAGERFYSAIFPIPTMTERSRKPVTIPVSMSTSGAVAGETDTTSAHGTITVRP